MPELAEQMYCSEQICIPPPFPYLLRQFAKAAIRTQPIDLLKWSTAYFRCLSLNIPPPVKPRLEYPIPQDYCGLTPGWLKALMYQLQNTQTVHFKILFDRWTGACLERDTLIKILCLGGFDDASAIPWLRFVGLCAAFLTENLTITMMTICEIMTEEPEGGSASITLETFLDLYKFIASIEASYPQKLQNLYFTDSLLSLWGEEAVEEEKAKEEIVESSAEEPSVVEESEKEIQKVVEEAELKEIVSCPSIAGDDTYSREYYIPPVTEEPEEEDEFEEGEAKEGEEVAEEEEKVEEEGERGEEEEGEEDEETLQKIEDMEEKDEEFKEATEGEEDTELDVDNEAFIRKQSESAKRLRSIMDEEAEEEQSRVSETDVSHDTGAEELEAYESAATIIEEPRKIEKGYEEFFEDEKRLVEDLERLRLIQEAEMAGETDEELEKYKCRLIAEMPLTDSQQEAIAAHRQLEEEKGEVEEEEEKEEEKEEPEPYEEVCLEAIPGIGSVVSEDIVESVCEYMKSMATIQHGMVMPRNIRHYNCPPLEIMEF